MSDGIRLEHVGIGVRADLFEETIRFYERVFGWHRIKESPGQLAFIGDGKGGRIEIIKLDAAPLPAPHHLAFVVAPEQFDAMVDALRAAGAQCQEPQLNPFGDRMLFFGDPAGNWAQIIARVEALAP